MNINEIKRWIVKISRRYNVDAAGVSMRLLSTDDKQDLLDGLITYDELDAAVRVWATQGCPARVKA